MEGKAPPPPPVLLKPSTAKRSVSTSDALATRMNELAKKKENKGRYVLSKTRINNTKVCTCRFD